MVVQLLMEGKFRRTTSMPIRNISNAALVWKGEDGTILNVMDLADWHPLLLR